MVYLAQVNIGKTVAPLSDPLMHDFVAQLDMVNEVADKSPGFIWRFQTTEGNATSLRPYEDDLIIFNMSVWATLEDYDHYVYASEGIHRQVLMQRRRWFQKFDGPYNALWWIPQGHIPSVEEAKERLEHLRKYGETEFAFASKRFRSGPGTEVKIELPEQML